MEMSPLTLLPTWAKKMNQVKFAMFCFGTKPIGEVTKFSRGRPEESLAVLPRSIHLRMCAETKSGWIRAEERSEMDDGEKCPEKPNRKPFYKPFMTKSARKRSGRP